MTTTVRAYSQYNNGNALSKKGFNAWRGDTAVWISQAGKGHDPLQNEGYNVIGRAKGIPEFAKNPTKEMITTGYPKIFNFAVPTEDANREFTFSSDMWTLAMLQVICGPDAIGINKASDGQTTVASGGSLTGATLTSITGLAVGDTVLVDTTDATFGGFKELAIITGITGSVVTWEGLSRAPADTATVEKLKTGTSKTTAGLILPDAAADTFESYNIVIARHLTGSRALFITHIPEFEVHSAILPTFSDPLSTASFTGMPKIQAEKSFVQVDGSTKTKPWYMEHYIMPYES